MFTSNFLGLAATLLLSAVGPGAATTDNDSGASLNRALGLCRASKVTHHHKFDHGKKHGWHNARTTKSDTDYGDFLGRYTAKHDDPFRTFSVNKHAEYVVVEWDFYEIDSWDGASRAYGPDSYGVKVDDDEFSMGFYTAWKDEGWRGGESYGGITWESDSAGPPRYIGFRDDYLDQIHHAKAIVPQSFFKDDGKIVFSFLLHLSSKSLNDESAGFDNIRVIEHFDCCLLYTSPSPRDQRGSRMPSSA